MICLLLNITALLFGLLHHSMLSLIPDFLRAALRCSLLTHFVHTSMDFLFVAHIRKASRYIREFLNSCGYSSMFSPGRTSAWLYSPRTGICRTSLPVATTQSPTSAGSPHATPVAARKPTAYEAANRS